MAKEESSKAITGNELVEIEYLKVTPFHKPGAKSKVHEEQAKKFVAKGIAKIVKA
jgi:hypothetical protein